MPTLLLYSLLVGFLTGFFSEIFSRHGDGYVVGRGALVGFLSAFVFFLGICYITTPTFAHWSDSGIVVAVLIITIFTTVASGLGSNDSAVGVTAGFMSFIILICYWVASGLFTGPWPCDVNANRTAVSQMLNFRELKDFSLLDNLRESSVERVSDERSASIARNHLKSGLGNVFTVSEAGYEQRFQDHPVQVHSLNARDWWSYSKAGNSTPGYVLVDVSKPEGYAEFKEHPMQYTFDVAPWDQYNAVRKVYLDFELPNGVRVEELQGIEIDDMGVPLFVGSVLKPSSSMGARIYETTGVVTLHPLTGEIKFYSREQLKKELPWLDRIVSVSSIEKMVETYASYQPGSTQCWFMSSAGQWKIDKIEGKSYVITTRNDEQYLQFSLTSTNNKDPKTTEVLYVQPRDGFAYRFPVDTVTIETAVKTIQNAVNQNVNPNLQNVVREPVFMWFGDQQFLVVILERGNSFNEFAAVRLDLAKSNNIQYVLHANSIQGLRTMAVEQIAQFAPGTGSGQTSQSVTEIVKTGTVEAISIPYSEQQNAPTKVFFNLVVKENGTEVRYTFSASTKLVASGFVSLGHELRVSAQAVSLNPSVPAEVSTIENRSYPPRTVTPVATAATR